MSKILFFFCLVTLILSACDRPSPSKSVVLTPTPASTPSPVITPRVSSKPKIPKRSQVTLAKVNPLKVEGNLIIAGSSTVYPLTKVMSERFVEEGYAGIIKLEIVGTGGGFRLFCQEDKIEMVNASRLIKAQEQQNCAKIGRNPVDFRIGTDAIAIVVNPANTFVKNLTRQELAAIFTAQKWSDVNPSWPNQPIKRFVPGIESGTFDFFVEAVLNNNAKPLLNAPNTSFSEDDEDLDQGVTTDEYAVGFFGYAYYAQDAKNLRILSVDGITPSLDTVENGKYPLSRPLFIYSDPKIMREKPQIAAFINFYLTNVNDEITEVGYFPLSPNALDASKTKFLNVLGTHQP